MSISASVYGGGPFYPGSSSALGILNETGFSTIICWSVHVNANGDLVYNNTPIVKDGLYIGDPSWGDALEQVKKGGSVERILFSVGSGGTSDYQNIMDIINSKGTGSDSILNKNFSALLAAIPAIDGIDMDDEDNFDHDTIVSFTQMLSDIGYKEVTFCPYMMPNFWIDCLQTIETSIPGFVTGFNLQCYSGGSGNLNYLQSEWIEPLHHAVPNINSKTFINPGLWCKHGNDCDLGMSAKEIENQFASVKDIGINGGFIWLYDDIMKCGNDPKSYAEAIINGLN